MLKRVLPIAFCGLMLSAGCKRSVESKLVGSWRGHTDEMAGQIWFASNHTFASHDWDATNSVTDAGDWHVSGDKLVLNFHRASRPSEATHVELPFTLFGDDTLVVRATNGKVNTFERQK
jgi:hypothetical protein